VEQKKLGDSGQLDESSGDTSTKKKKNGVRLKNERGNNEFSRLKKKHVNEEKEKNRGIPCKETGTMEGLG